MVRRELREILRGIPGTLEFTDSALDLISHNWIRIERVAVPRITSPLDPCTERRFRGGQDHITLCRSNILWIQSLGGKGVCIEPRLSGCVADLMWFEGAMLVECGGVDLGKVLQYVDGGWSVLVAPYGRDDAVLITVNDRASVLRRARERHPSWYPMPMYRGRHQQYDFFPSPENAEILFGQPFGSYDPKTRCDHCGKLVSWPSPGTRVGSDIIVLPPGDRFYGAVVRDGWLRWFPYLRCGWRGVDELLSWNCKRERFALPTAGPPDE